MNPEEYRKKALKRRDQEIEEIRSQTNKLCADEERKAENKIAESKEGIANSSSISSGFLIGGGIAAVALFIYMVFAFPDAGFMLGIIPAILFIVLLVLGFVIQSSYVRSVNDLISKVEANRDKQIQEHTQSCAESVAAIQDRTQKAIEDQKASHERDRREESVKYASSAVSKEIIEKLLDGFKKTIESSDRRSHVRRIVIPLHFCVYDDKVDTPYGLYDFKIERVAKLSGEEARVALANAIAQNVQTEILMSYPADLSGGEVAPMEINIEYKSNSVAASMIYSADNANFVPERSF